LRGREAPQAVVVFEGDQQAAIGKPGQGLGVLPGLAGQQQAPGVAQGAPLAVGDAGEVAGLVVGETRGDPAPGVGDGGEARAVGRDHQVGEAAEARVLGAKQQAAAPAQVAGGDLGLVFGIEAQRRGLQLERRLGRGGRGEEQQAEKEGGKGLAQQAGVQDQWTRAPRRAPGAAMAAALSSSKSSASFSITVPPSCSASTMVTARR
jgi:hypothetical protein